MSDRSDSVCAHPDVGRLLVRYEFGAVSTQEKALFERHLFECDACFAELERGSLLTRVLHEHPDRFRAVLERADASAGVAPVDAAAPAPKPRAPVRTGAASRRTGAWASLRARAFRPWVAVPAAAAGLLVVGVLRFARAPDPSRLATFPRDEMGSTALRAPGIHDDLRELLDTGAGYFDTGRYDEAARYFQAARDRDPKLAEAAFALGLALALAGDARTAIPHLRSAVESAQGNLRDRARWVLANAYLRVGDVSSARRELELLEATPGEWSGRAQTLVHALRE